MKFAHLVKLSVFSHGNEDKDSILNSLLGFFPFSLEAVKVPVKRTSAKGFNEGKIEIFEVTIAKTSLISRFLKALLEKMDADQKSAVLQQAESRLDENLDFFLRFDKYAWVNDKILRLTDSGKCFHLRISMAAFPKKRELALNAVKGLFS
jgi:RNA binding exosome subunit